MGNTQSHNPARDTPTQDPDDARASSVIPATRDYYTHSRPSSGPRALPPNLESLLSDMVVTSFSPSYSPAAEAYIPAAKFAARNLTSLDPYPWSVLDGDNITSTSSSYVQQPQTGRILVPGDQVFAETTHINGRLDLFCVGLEDMHLSLYDLPDLSELPIADFLETLRSPQIQCLRPEVVPSVPPFSDIDISRRDFAGLIAELLVVTTDSIIAALEAFSQKKEWDSMIVARDKLAFKQELEGQIKLQWPNFREHVYNFVASHLQLAVSVMVQKGLPCSLPSFRVVLKEYFRLLITDKPNLKTAFSQAWNQYAIGGLPLANPDIGQIAAPSAAELRGAIEIVSSASTRRDLMDGEPAKHYTIQHRPGYDDALQPITYRGNRYWLSDAELDALAVLNRESRPSTAGNQPIQLFAAEMLQEIGTYLSRDCRRRARLVCHSWRAILH